MKNIQWETFSGESLLDALSSETREKLQYLLSGQTEVVRQVIDEAVAYLGADPFVVLMQKSFLDWVIRRLKLSDAQLMVFEALVVNFNENGFVAFSKSSELYDSIDEHGKKIIPFSLFRLFFKRLFAQQVNSRLQILFRIIRELSVGDMSHLSASYVRYVYLLLERMNADQLAEWFYTDKCEELESFQELLAQLPIAINEVKFRFTYHCNIECRHCYNSSGPRNNTEALCEESMLRIVRQMPDVGIASLSVTGGEPLLFKETVVKLIREARLIRIPCFGIVTNGFWGKSEKMAHQMLMALKQAGYHDGETGQLDWMQISTGDFHGEFIPIGTALTAAQVYFEIFQKPVELRYETLSPSLQKKVEVAAELWRRRLTDKVKLTLVQVRPFGRGKELACVEDANGETDPRCGFHPAQLVFDADGRVRPCCGLNSEIDGLVIGTIDDDLISLCDALRNDPILQCIDRQPLTKLLSVSDRPSGPFSPNPCMLCSDILKNKGEADRIRQRLMPIKEFYPVGVAGTNKAF